MLPQIVPEGNSNEFLLYRIAQFSEYEILVD